VCSAERELSNHKEITKNEEELEESCQNLQRGLRQTKKKTPTSNLNKSVGNLNLKLILA